VQKVISFPPSDATSAADSSSGIYDRPRSVSQVKEYAQCPHRFQLHRVEHAWERPAAWFPQGNAVHEAAEAWERSGRQMSLEDAQDAFRDSYVKHVSELCEETPNLDWWFSSGPYNGEADLERRFGLGLAQVERYLDYYTELAPREVIWITPDGTPAIELPFEMELDGVKVRGVIDQMIEMPLGEIRVRDIKTGNSPGDDLQLGTYKVAEEQEHGVTIRRGDYWMGRNGKPTVPYNIEEWTKEKVTEVFKETDEGIKAGDFFPDPEPSKCRFCTVAHACVYAV
jgi:putative RecB family exonuclease